MIPTIGAHMVHLADVSDTGMPISSEWFKRGWALQELLVPRSLLFSLGSDHFTGEFL